MSFPNTKYMGSKQAILPFIMHQFSNIRFDTALDAFSGSACVAYALKQQDKRVVANDFLKFAYHLAKATIENNGTTITKAELGDLMRPSREADSFIREKFAGLYFSERDCTFLDTIYANIQKLRSPLKRSIALAALIRACMKKRPRGIFTFVGHKGWDARKDLRLSMKTQFLNAVQLINSAVFSNGKRNKATCLDVFEISPKGVNLVYIDTPYVTPHSDCDYTRRYHFVEGLCSYWKEVEIQEDSITKKIKSYPTAFSSKSNISESFLRLFEHFKDCKIVVSYGSNGIPGRNEMVKILQNFKRSVKVAEIPHKYCFGNHRHRVGNNNNGVMEYLFVAT
jgi:DNA adenine methylase